VSTQENKPNASEADNSRAFAVKTSVIIIAVALAIWALGFIVLPVIEARSAGYDSFTAICRALGISTPGQQTANPTLAAPPSSTAWDSTTRDAVTEGDAARGAALAEDTCTACHAPNGQSTDPATIPSTTGLSARAIYKQLHDIKRGERPNELMKPLLDDLNEKQLADLAAYYSSLPKRNHDIRALNEPTGAAVMLATKGDITRALPACNACHGSYTGGPLEAPSLTGQYPEYIAAQLKAYATGARKNDIYGRMRRIAEKLTDQEIKDISAYYDAPR